MGLFGWDIALGAIRGMFCPFGFGDAAGLFICSSSTSSSRATFFEPAPSQLGIAGSESASAGLAPDLLTSNSAYWGGAAAPEATGAVEFAWCAGAVLALL